MKGQNKTEVFILIEGEPYEGEAIIGVYASEEIALKKAKTIKPSDGKFSKVENTPYVHEWKVAKPLGEYMYIEKHKVMEK